MNHKIIVVSLLACLLLCGCRSDKNESKPEQETTNTAVVSFSEEYSTEEETAETIVSTSIQESETVEDNTESPAQSESQLLQETVSTDEDLTVPDEESSIVTTINPPEKVEIITTQLTEGNDLSDDSELNFIEESPVMTEKQSRGTESVTTTAEIKTEIQVQTTTLQTTESESVAKPVNDMPDDGLNWSPLVPVE